MQWEGCPKADTFFFYYYPVIYMIVCIFLDFKEISFLMLTISLISSIMVIVRENNKGSE